jgi:hypothetical protein
MSKNRKLREPLRNHHNVRQDWVRLPVVISTRLMGFDIWVCLGSNLGPRGQAKFSVELGARPSSEGRPIAIILSEHRRKKAK